MKPINFPEQTVTVARDQPEYLPLPAYQNERETISLWKLTIVERLLLLITGRLWFRQLNFGSPLQPQAPSVSCPFVRGSELAELEAKSK